MSTSIDPIIQQRDNAAAPPVQRLRGQLARAARLGSKGLVDFATWLDRRPDWHRHRVGGLWDKMGDKQFEYLCSEGLLPKHRMLDIGCGSLRGGIRFIGYLDAGHYTGVEREKGLLDNGRAELRAAGVTDKDPVLVVNGDFDFHGLGTFDFALAQSVFSHLDVNSIMRCLASVEQSLRPGGRFYATFFPCAPPRLMRDPIVTKTAWGKPSTLYPNRDPYCYDPDVFRWMCEGSDLKCDYRGDWDHPWGQHMLVFTRL